MEVERAELLSVRAFQGLCGEALMPLQIPRDAANACPLACHQNLKHAPTSPRLCSCCSLSFYMVLGFVSISFAVFLSIGQGSPSVHLLS